MAVRRQRAAAGAVGRRLRAAVRRRAAATAMCLGLSLAAASAQPAPAPDPIDEYVAAQMREQNIPGLAIAVIRGGVGLRVQGYGSANLEHAVPVGRDSVFQSGSIGKLFTAVAAMLLVEDGTLALDSPLTTWLPDAPQRWSRITPRHLLNHTSGLADPELDLRREYSSDEFLQIAYASAAPTEPGQRWRYSNMGYVVLGILIERAGGKPYGDVLAERVFRPLGMAGARVISDSAIVPHRVAGYIHVDGGLRNQDWASASINSTADGSLYLSVRDFVAWEKAVSERRLLRPESWEQVLAPARLGDGSRYPYGFGWQLGGDPSHGASMGHGGAWQGFRAYYQRYDRDAVAFVVLANSDSVRPGEILAGLAALTDRRYALPPARAIADTAPPLRRQATRLVGDLRAGRLAPTDLPDLPRERAHDRLARWRAALNEAGECRRPSLVQDRRNGDLRERIYRLRCDKQAFELEVQTLAEGPVQRADLRPVASVDEPLPLR